MRTTQINMKQGRKKEEVSGMQGRRLGAFFKEGGGL